MSFNRIVTHTDFDGIVSAYMLAKIHDISVDNIEFTNPQNINCGEFETFPGDIVCDLPCPKIAGLWFDHHISSRPLRVGEKEYEADREQYAKVGQRVWGDCPSAVRVIYEHYREQLDSIDQARFKIFTNYADKIDGARLTRKDISNPDAPQIISITLRTGNWVEDCNYKTHIIKCLLAGLNFFDIIKYPEVVQRYDDKNRVRKQWKPVAENRLEMRRDGVAVLDVTDLDNFRYGSYHIYNDHYDEIDYLITIYGKSENHVGIQVGYNIFKRDKSIVAHIGNIMRKFDGGGHKGVGGCEVEKSRYKLVVEEILSIISTVNEFSIISV